MAKAKTIRMSKNEKADVKLAAAVSGMPIVRTAIATEFNKQHADFDTSEFDIKQSATQKRLKKGLKANAHTINPHRTLSVQAQYEWTPEYVKKETEKAKEQGRRPYLYGAGTYGPHNSKITDAEGVEQKHHDGSQKYRWEWRGLQDDAISNFMDSSLKSAIHNVTRPDTEHEAKYNRNNRAGDLQSTVTRMARLQAYIELDYHYHPKGARSIVSKRANPYRNDHYVLRESGNGSQSDYYSYPLLGLNLPYAIIRKGREILATIEGLLATMTDMVSKSNNSEYHTRNVEQYTKNVKQNEADYENLIEMATDNGRIALGIAIKSDEIKRAEVTEYMKNVPHADLLNNSSLTPTFRLIPLGERIKRAEERIVQSKATLAREQTRLQEHTSDLPKLEYQISLMKAQNLAVKLGLIDGGEEE
jgi:hypothetical protein